MSIKEIIQMTAAIVIILLTVYMLMILLALKVPFYLIRSLLGDDHAV